MACSRRRWPSAGQEGRLIAGVAPDTGCPRNCHARQRSGGGGTAGQAGRVAERVAGCAAGAPSSVNGDTQSQRPGFRGLTRRASARPHRTAAPPSAAEPPAGRLASSASIPGSRTRGAPRVRRGRPWSALPAAGPQTRASGPSESESEARRLAAQENAEQTGLPARRPRPQPWRPANPGKPSIAPADRGDSVPGAATEGTFTLSTARTLRV